MPMNTRHCWRRHEEAEDTARRVAAKRLWVIVHNDTIGHGRNANYVEQDRQIGHREHIVNELASYEPRRQKRSRTLFWIRPRGRVSSVRWRCQKIVIFATYGLLHRT